MKIILVVIYCLLEISLAFSQGERNNWMISDSTRIDFSNGAVNISFQGYNTAFENMATYSDKNGNLLFYTGYNYPSTNTINIFGSNNNIIPNGIIINVYETLSQGALFLPHPSDSNLVYFFYVEVILGVSSKLKYSIIDRSLNNGIGAVIQNNMTASDSSGTEMIAACKHGNGRDWWIVRHSLNDYCTYFTQLFSPQGISIENVQTIGTSLQLTNNSIAAQNISKFNKTGNLFTLSARNGVLDVFDFDRCTGQLNNYRELGGPNYINNFQGYYGVEFSTSGRFVYGIKNFSLSDTIIQFDLQAPNPKADRRVVFIAEDSLFNGASHHFQLGNILLGVDNKIYFTRQNNHNAFSYSNTQARSMSVINYPDFKDSLCNIDPYSIPIPSYNLRIGLPNLAHYDLGPLTGSPCDTLTAGLDESSPAISPSIHAMYNTSSGSINIYVQGLRGKNIKVMLYDLQGRLIKTAQSKTNGSTFAYTLKVNDLRNALYIVHLQSEKEVLSVKVMVE